MAKEPQEQEAQENKKEGEERQEEEKQATGQDQRPETEEEENSAQEEASETGENPEEEEMDELQKRKEEIEGLNNKYLRLYSEFDNYKKRTAKEKRQLIDQAGSDVMKDILPVMDDLERAIEANEKIESEDEHVDGLKTGFELIHQKLKGILEGKGLKPMNSKGEEFNTDLHEAMTRIPAPEEEMKGKVVDVVEKGYWLNDTVLRYAKVVVGE